MADPRQLVDEFAMRFEAGEEPNPAEWLERVEPDRRQELGDLIDRYLMTAPRRAWDPVAYETSAAKQAVDRVFDSIEGVSGTWPELLPQLRNAARIKRTDLVRRLAEALGVGTAEPQVAKVADYYNQMEHGNLPAEGVSAKVIDALAGIVGATAEQLRQAGGGTAGPAGGAAFARMTAPKQMMSAPAADMDFVAESADMAAGPPERDEIDRLFTEG